MSADAKEVDKIITEYIAQIDKTLNLVGMLTGQFQSPAQHKEFIKFLNTQKDLLVHHKEVEEEGEL